MQILVQTPPRSKGNLLLAPERNGGVLEHGVGRKGQLDPVAAGSQSASKPEASFGALAEFLPQMMDLWLVCCKFVSAAIPLVA